MSQEGRIIRLARAQELPHEPALRFGVFDFDRARFELRRNGVALAVPTLSLKLLQCLLDQRERVVTRQELVREVWDGTVLSEGSLRQAVWELRQTLEDDAEAQRVIRTVRGRGYQFVATVHDADERSSRALGKARAGPRAHPLVGRESELAHLERALAATFAQGGRACVLVGPPGVGKTHLSRELALRCADHGFACLRVAADPDGAAPAFWPWLQLLRVALAQIEVGQRHALLERHPQAARLLTPGVEGAASSNLELGALPVLFGAATDLTELLLACLARDPTLMVLEDLQWFDEGSLALLKHLLQGLHATRTLLLVSSRTQPTRDNRALARALEGVARSASGCRLDLSCFDQAQVRELLASYTTDAFPPGVSAQVYALTRGNALFTTELALLLAASEGRCIGEDLPADAALVIQRRLRCLPEAALHVLKAAAVLGLEFRLAEILALVDRPAREVLTQLEVCFEHGVLLELGERSFAFVHPLTREVAYKLLSSVERGRFHGRAGDWLERFSVDVRGTRMNELAHHFQRALPEGDSRKAVAYTLRCAQAAYAATAYQDAVAHYDRALGCLDLDPRASLADKLDVALLRLEARRAMGADATALNAAFQALADQAESIGDTQRFAKAVLGYTGQRHQRFTLTRFIGSTSAQEVALIERALTALGTAPTELRALLLCSLMGALVYSTEKRRRDLAAEESLSIARMLKRPGLLIRVLLTQVYCCAEPVNAERRLEQINELIEVAQQHGLRNSLVEALITRAMCHLGRGDVDAARADELNAKQLAADHVPARIAARAQLLDLMRAFWDGDLARARVLTQQLHQAASDDLAERTLFLMRSAALQLQESGDAQAPRMTFEAMLCAYPGAVSLHCALASYHATVAERERAVEHFEVAAREDFAALPRHLGWLGDLALLADAACWLDDAPRARRVYDALVPYANVFDFFLGEAAPAGPVAFWLASLAVAFRDLGLARQWLRQAYAINEQLGATMLNEHARMVEARIDALSGDMGTRRALAKLDQVSSYAAARGLRWLERCSQIQRDRLAGVDGAGRGSRVQSFAAWQN